jgi:hypothetical protein
MSRVKPLILALILASPLMARADAWVSIYGGSEVSFSGSDRAKLESLLEALGVEHRVDSDRSILVNRESRAAIVDLISRSWTRRIIRPEAR